MKIGDKYSYKSEYKGVKATFIVRSITNSIVEYTNESRKIRMSRLFFESMIENGTLTLLSHKTD